MSSSGQGGSGEQGDKPRGLAKFMRRASLVLKRDKSKRQSLSGPSQLAPVSDSGAASSSIPKTRQVNSSTYSHQVSQHRLISCSPFVAAPAPTKTRADSTPALSVPAGISQIIKENRPTPTTSKTKGAMTAKESYAIQEEKARALFAKYGLTLELGEWSVPATEGVPRVEKQVRMRIHRTCHRCQTTFGADRVCSHCQHTRCKKCPQFPGGKSKSSKAKGLAVGGVAADDGLGKKPDTLTMAHRATGKEMTTRAPTQRVRRKRDPSKTDKHSTGHPGDSEETFPLARREIKNIRTRVRWNCEKCDRLFKDTEKTCGGCGHEKCDDCPRNPPQRVKQAPDEDAVKSVEERMKKMDLSPQASAA